MLLSGSCCATIRQMTCSREGACCKAVRSTAVWQQRQLPVKAGCNMSGLPLPLVDHSACLLQGCQALGQHEMAMPRRVGRWLQGVRGCQLRCSAGVSASCRAVSSGLLYFVANRASEASHPVGPGCRMSEDVDGGAQSVYLPPAGLSGAQMADNSGAPQDGAAGSALPAGDGTEPAAENSGLPPAAAGPSVDAAAQPGTPPFGASASSEPETC